MHTTAHAQEVDATILRRPIFMKDQRIDLVRPYVDTTTTPDSATAMRMSNITRPPSRPRCATASRLAIVDALETTPLHQETKPQVP